MRMVYLAYPIDNASADERFLADVAVAKELLSDRGVDIVFDPGDAFQVRRGATLGREIHHINSVALARATGVLAFLPARERSVGVPQEIDRAVQAGKLVALVSNAASWNLVHPRIKQFPEDQYMEAAIWLAAQDEERIDTRSQPLQVKILDHHGQAPTKAHADDAGFDLYVSDDVIVEPGQFVDIELGVAVRLPPWSYGRLIGRSSTFRKKGLLVLEGIIDAGYTGPLYVGVYNPGVDAVAVAVGDRIAQLIVEQNASAMMDVQQVEDLGWTARGSKGFGSSGS